MSYRYVSPIPWFTNAYAGRRTDSADRVRRQVSLKGSHPSEAKELGGGSASINGEFRALEETRAICREEDNGFAKSKPLSPAVNTTSPRAARLGVAPFDNRRFFHSAAHWRGRSDCEFRHC